MDEAVFTVEEMIEIVGLLLQAFDHIVDGDDLSPTWPEDVIDSGFWIYDHFVEEGD